MKKGNNPIAGIFVGFIFVIGGLILLWWNEGRTVKTEAAIKEAEQNYIDVNTNPIDSANEGKLIASNGTITIDKKLNDDVFGVEVETAKLKRVVEVYQWVESCETDSDNNETCTYEQRWEDDLIDSSKFKESVDHTNPKTMKYENKTILSNNVKTGDLVIPENLVKTLSTKGKVVLSTTNDDNRYAAYQLGLKITEDGAYYTDVVANAPQVGNIRVSFEYNDAKALSYMGVQKGNTLEAYKAKSGYDIYHIYEGVYDGKAMIQMMRDSNRTIKIICRVVGIILVIIGLLAIISPIQKVASYVPVLGAIFNGATTLVAIILGIAISIIDIAIAWIFYRPVLGIILLAVALALIVISVIIKNRNKKGTTQQA